MAPNQHGRNHYDTQRYATDQAADVNRGQRNLPQEDRSRQSEIQADIAQDQAAKLAPDVQMGNDRVVTPMNWNAFTSTQLHQQATNNNSPGTADSLGRGFNEGGNRLAESANRLFDAIGMLDAAWSGQAASSAKSALAPLAQSAGKAGTAAQYMGSAMSQQAAAAGEVKRLPPPKEFDAQTALTSALANPNPIAGLADMAKKSQEAKATKQEQVGYLNSYTQQMSAIDAATPTFVPPKDTVGGGGNQGGFTGGGGVDYSGVGGGTNQRRPGTTGGDDKFRPPTVQPGDNRFTNPNHVGTNLPQGTDINGWTPPSSNVNHVNLPQNNPQPVNFNQPTGGPNFAGGPFGPGGSPGTGTGTGSGSGSGRGGGNFGGARPGGGGGTPGMGPKGGFGPGGGAGAGGVGGGNAMGAGGGRGMGAAGARGGAGMAGGMGGQGGQGEEDTEHQRPSYLIEPDPEDTFGTDQMTAPPVIGE